MAYRFGGSTLDPETRQLLLDGDEIHMSPKAFESAGDARREPHTSRLELNFRATMAIHLCRGDEPCNAVAEIRRALRDSAANLCFVPTVYGFGYRFVQQKPPKI